MNKILFLNDSGNFGGAQIIFKNIMKYCDLTAYDVDVLFGSNGPIYELVKEIGYKINYVQELVALTPVKEIKLLLRYMFVMNTKIKEGDYNIVYANGFLGCVASGILSYKYRKVKFIWHEHNLPRSKVRRTFLRIISKNIEKIIVVSDGIKDNYFINGEKLKVIYNGIESDDKCYLPNKSNDLINFGIVSRIDIGKGHLEVIKSFNKVNNPNSRLYIIGGAVSEESKKIEAKIIKASEENPNIIFVGFTSEVDKYYKFLDFVIQASTMWDSLPTSLLEGMNYNCALIGTNIGGIPEIINKLNGYIVNRDNIEYELEDLFNNIKKDDSLSNLQLTSKIVLKEKFVIEKQMQDIKRIIDSISN